MKNPYPLIIDNGSYSIKSGFMGDSKPSYVIESIVGEKDGEIYLSPENILKDDEMDKQIEVVKRGVISNFGMLERIWDRVFGELKINEENLKEYSILMTQSSNNKKEMACKTIECLFERFQIPYFTFCNQSLLSLYSHGKIKGTVLNVGGGVTELIKAFDGNIVTSKIFEVGGREVTKLFKKMLIERGNDFLSKYKCNFRIDEIKKVSCFASLNYEKDINPSNKDLLETKIKLPCGNIVNFSNERFLASKVFFDYESNYEAVNRGGFGNIGKLLFDFIGEDKEYEIKKLLYWHSNVFITGGGSMLQNFVEKTKDLFAPLVPSKYDSVVRVHSSRIYSAFYGASILCSLSGIFSRIFVSKQNYDEFGSTKISEKSFHFN
eukprot:TRINITY_DN3355_c0_g1_i2.p1 TRINITY_DN3355_c0_g1~~TRINITY_DN3355_c0_g1_i2.p1  ORF type:complete len:385 (-),score=85.58 TRINITY_DN3355_c0_g1_i2:209-1342(-)